MGLLPNDAEGGSCLTHYPTASLGFIEAEPAIVLPILESDEHEESPQIDQEEETPDLTDPLEEIVLTLQEMVFAVLSGKLTLQSNVVEVRVTILHTDYKH